MAKKPQRSALTFIFITILIDVTGLGIIIPVVPQLIMELTGEGLSKAAMYGGWLMFCYAFVQFIFAPIIGGLSDRFGRRPVLLLSLAGFGLDYIVTGFAPNIYWLFGARIIAGITGASTSTANAYIADVSPPEKKAQNFGLVGAAFGIGFIIGPVIGGLLGELGSRIPFFVAAWLAFLNCIYGYFILPESLPKERRRPFEWKRANPIGSLNQIRKFPAISGLVIVFFLLYLSHHATSSTWTYFTMLKFGWNEAMVGFSLGIVGISVAIVQGGLTRIVIPKIGEVKSVYVGLFFSTIGSIGFALSPTGTILLAVIFPFALGGFTAPSLQSIISNEVNDDQQGEVQGALASLISFTAIIGPPFMTGLFGYFSSDGAPIELPGAAFLAGASLTFISLLFAIYIFKKNQQRTV